MNWMLMPLRRYVDFSGRSRRKEYWLWALLNFIVAALLAIPLTVITVNAFRQVEQQGGVRYRTDFGSPSERFDAGRPPSESAADDLHNRDGDKPNRVDDWSANPGPAASDEQGTGSDNGSGDTGSSESGDKVSSRGTALGEGAGILAYSRGIDYAYGASVDIDPVMFFRAFGPIGWALFSIYCLWGLVTFIPNLAVAIRRLHDTDRSGWWLLIGCVPLVGAIVLLVFLLTEGTRGPNRFGADPKAADIDRTFD